PINSIRVTLVNCDQDEQRTRPAPSPNQTPACRGLVTQNPAGSGQARSRLGEGRGGRWRVLQCGRASRATPSRNPSPPQVGPARLAHDYAQPGQARVAWGGESAESVARLYIRHKRRRPLVALVLCLGLIVPWLGGKPVVAEPAAGEPGVRVPGFWDPRRRPERPDMSRVSVIRFLTEIDYPPFNYAGPDGNPQGFNVDLARMLCEELKLACTIQMRRFETLVSALAANQGDAAIASIAATRELRAKVDFTDPYYRTPARFAAKRDSPIDDPLPERLEGKKVAVVAGTAHEAYLKALFTEVELRPYPSADVARLALRRGDVDLLFADAISLAFWLNGTDSENCRSFRGGPYIDSRYFGEGIGIAVRKGNDTIRLALNWALFRVW